MKKCQWQEYGESPERPCDGEVKNRYWPIEEPCDPENGPSPDDVPYAGDFCEKHWVLIEKEFIRYHSHEGQGMCLYCDNPRISNQVLVCSDCASIHGDPPHEV